MADVSPELESESRTLSALLRQGVQLLADAGIENAVNESAWIVEFVLAKSRVALHVEGQQAVKPSDWAHAMILLARRASREPLQYILGTQEFCGLDFEVAPDALIPRPETELLVEEAVRRCASLSSSYIADIGTGSGCIAVALAKRLPNARVYAVDISEPALALARRNAIRHAADMVTFLHGDLLAPIERLELGRRFAAIVSNPPYIADGDFPTLPQEVRAYEPRLALSGGPNGLEIYRNLIHDAVEYLVPEGWLILEMGDGQAEQIRRMAREENGYGAIRTRSDHAGIERVLILEKE